MIAQDLLPGPTPVSATAYIDPPWWYDIRGFCILKLSYRGSLWEQISFFERNLSDDHLEVAIGTGTLLSYALRLRRWRRSPLPRRLVGIDYAERMLAGAERRLGKVEGLTLRQGDAAHLELPDCSFQTANLANAFHCIADAAGALGELHRVLVPGGTLAMNVLLHPRGNAVARWVSSRVNAWGQRKGILDRPYGQDEVREMVVAHGFTIEREHVSGNAYWLVAQKAAN